jgi:hypothetical protein
MSYFYFLFHLFFELLLVEVQILHMLNLSVVTVKLSIVAISNLFVHKNKYASLQDKGS